MKTVQISRQTPNGDEIRELSDEEIRERADNGEPECMKAVLEDDLLKASGDVSKRLDAIEKFLGV